MKILSDIREFFWPLLEKFPIAEPDLISQENITVDKSHLEKTLEYAISCYKAELDREKIIEGKSSLFIGTISVITSVIIGVTSVLVNLSDFNIAILVLVFLLFVLTLYMSRTVWFSIKVLERKKYYSISIDDFLISDANEIYYKKLIAEIMNNERRNSLMINRKVDNMTMAQEYFKRAIIIVVLYSFIIFVFFLSKSGANCSISSQDFIDLINCIEIKGWNTLILYVLTLSSFILSLIAIKRNK